MHWDYGWGMGFGFGWLLMILFWALLILGIVYLVKLIAGSTKKEEKAATAIDIIMLPDVLAEIKKEHKARTKGFKYTCLVPNSVKPVTEDFMKYHVKTRW